MYNVNIWMNTMVSTASLANDLRAVAGAFRPLSTHKRYLTTER